jgi:hypothetical protein
MSDTYNRYGLSRDIGEENKRIIRRACGFGCVCCGLAIASYEHIDPEFNDAKTHDPDKIAYLCEGCHSRVTRNFWSKEKVKQARKNPWCITHGKCHDAFDVSSSMTVVWLGPNKIINLPTILQVNDEPLLSIEPPEIENGPYRISGRFYDDQGDLLFSIIQNEWFGESANWDIECVGGLITIRKASRQIALQLRAIPSHGILVERADMFYHGIRMTADHYHVKVTALNGSAIEITGRTIVGKGEGAVLFSGQTDGGMKMGPGPFVIEAVPFSPPPHPPIIREKVGRNEMCPCGSGLKYKKCCLSKRN